MPSGQDYGNRLRDDVRSTVSRFVSKLEGELSNLERSFSSSLTLIKEGLDATRNLDIPSAERLFQEAAEDAAQLRKQETAKLAESAQTLTGKETQEDILNCLLDTAHHYAPRAVLFVVRSEQFVGWSSRGFSEGLGAHLSQFSLSKSESPLLQQALVSDTGVSNESTDLEEKLRGALQAEAGSPWHAFSLKVLGRPLAVLFAASDSERTCDANSLSIVVRITGLCIENLALKILQEISTTPSAGTKVSAPPAQRGTPEPSRTVPLRESPLVTPAASQPELATQGPQPVVEPAQVSGVSASSAAAAATDVAGESSEAAGRAARETAKSLAESAANRSYTPMEIVRELSEEERLHSEAKRFARLLVSEIKLYNERKVVEGRENKDLYVRLKRDIDRSRDMYEKRVSAVVASKIDYFHDELIRILGENDPSTLGSDYPGPRVES